ncbi:MAG: DUF3379 family protein, partial [Pseudomonadota bacterium]|nr:DUF3379 family protein [Pseudomonadota bacterium]
EQEQLLALEHALESSFDMAVPEGFEDRLLAISRNEKESGKGRSGPFAGRIWQMAASIMLVIGLVVYLGLNQYSPLNNAYALEVTVINHITDELNQLHGSHDVSHNKLSKIMAAINTQTRGDIGKLNYASKCQIRKNAGAHLIVNGESGPVTVLVMPGEYIDRDINIRSGRFDGAIYPTGYGSLAVVGEKGEYIPPIAEKMLQGIVATSI